MPWVAQFSLSCCSKAGSAWRIAMARQYVTVVDMAPRSASRWLDQVLEKIADRREDCGYDHLARPSRGD